MIGKRFRSLPFIFANDNYTLSRYIYGKLLKLPYKYEKPLKLSHEYAKLLQEREKPLKIPHENTT